MGNKPNKKIEIKWDKKLSEMAQNATKDVGPTLDINKIIKCVTFIRDNPNNPTKPFLRDYAIIMMVTVMENFSRDLAITLINKGFPVPEGTLHISFDNIKKLDKVTLGQLITTQYNFQNLFQINELFSNLLGIDFFQNIQPNSVKKTLLKITEERNRIVHDMKTFSKSDKEFTQYADTMIHFLFGFALLVGNALKKKQ